MLESFEPDLPIRTDRLLLRPLTDADVPALLAYRGDADVCRWLPFPPMDEAEVRRRLREQWSSTLLSGPRSSLTLGIEADGVLVGDVVLFVTDPGAQGAEIGWVLSPRHEGRGYATEAGRAVLAIAFDGLGAHRVVARMDPANHGSAAVAARLGMRREAPLVEDERAEGERAGTLLYARLAREHRGSAP